MLVFDKLSFHDFMFEVKLEHLFVVFLQCRVEHIRKDVLLNQLLLLLSRLLLPERLQFLTAVVLGTLDKGKPQLLLVVKGALMGDQKVVKQLDFDKVFFGDDVGVGLWSVT